MIRVGELLRTTAGRKCVLQVLCYCFGSGSTPAPNHSTEDDCEPSETIGNGRDL